MKKINAKSKTIAIVCFSLIQIVCIIIATAFACGDNDDELAYDVVGAVAYIAIAVFFSYLKHLVVNGEKEIDDDDED